MMPEVQVLPASGYSYRRMDQIELVFATQSYGYLQTEVCELLGCTAGHVERRQFADGEQYQRIYSEVTGKDVVLLGGTISDADTLELFDLACGIVDGGAARLTLVIPYFGYATMERAVHLGEVVTAKTRARLLSAIPQAAHGNRVFLLDLHSEGIPHYFEGEMRAVHLYAKPVIREIALQVAAGAPFVLACTDAGRAKWVESLANDLGVRASFVFKRRVGADQTEVSAVSAHVQDQLVLIYDDMIRTGGSLINAARAYREAGASRIAALTTHGLFPGNALERIADSGLFFQLVCTNSHPRAVELGARAGGLLQVRSVGPLIAEHLRHP